MISWSGRSVWPHEPDSAPSIDDIAVGLSRIVRFAGQTDVFYTVLMHTFVVSELVTRDARVYALLHDAPESMVSDVPTPWKTDAARAHEDELMRRICAEQGIAWPPPDDLWCEVMEADAWALEGEAHALGHRAAAEFWPRGEWGSYHFEAEYKTKAYMQAAPRLITQPEEAARLYRERFALAKAHMRSDAIAGV